MSDSGLQFDRAERAAPSSGASCAFCKQPISSTYYEINGQVACPRCRSQILAAWNKGSPGIRFAKALGLGAAAAAVGAGVYFGIEAMTGYEFGLVAIVVGLLVGGAVRKGSTGRGGWRYQALAMFLTYSAIVGTDSSLIAREMTRRFRARADSIKVSVAPDAAPAGIAASVAAVTDSAGTQKGQHAGPLVFALGFMVLLALAYVAPIAIGVSSPLHFVIAGIALYEAWKLNRGGALRVTGPYQASASSAAA
ncbi:MAG TPA: hypothetical protein VGV12_09530 [Gemmatimonadales bacterium]|nr:hypothetical protein [Gemmatimonadales bacterium]